MLESMGALVGLTGGALKRIQPLRERYSAMRTALRYRDVLACVAYSRPEA